MDPTPRNAKISLRPQAQGPHEVLALPREDAPLSVILKVVGERCNLDCAYCYEKRKPYDGSRLLRPEIVRAFLEKIGPRALSVELHGGEPLLAPMETIRAILAELRRHPRPVALRMQTNATLLTPEWLDLFAAEWPDLQMGVSLDGDLAANDLRLDLTGGSSHSAAEHALGLLADREMEVGVIAVVTRGRLGHADELLRYFASLRCVRVVKLAPCFDFGVTQGEGPWRASTTRSLMLRAVDSRMPWAITPREFSSFLLDAWRAFRDLQLHRRFLLEPHASVIRALHGRPTADCHFSSHKCAHVLTLYPDGRVGTCDELERPSAILGAVEAMDRALDQAERWRRSAVAAEVEPLLRRCQECTHRATCGGGCLASRLRLEAIGLGDEYCWHRKELIDHVARDLDLA